MTSSIRYRVGDSFLLFDFLGYSYDRDLPIKVVPGVHFAERPESILRQAELPFTCFVLPKYGTGANQSLRCLHSPVAEDPYYGKPRMALFFEYVSALRLVSPKRIGISGSFELASGELPFNNPALYNLQTPWNNRRSDDYTGPDIDMAARVLRSIVRCSRPSLPRLHYALVLFTQITCGFSSSFQLGYLGLFAVLEALFQPDGNKARTLAERVSTFLCNVANRAEVRRILEGEYISGRSTIAHGRWQLTPSSSLPTSLLARLGFLHECARLSLLGFLSMSHDQVAELSVSGKLLQNRLKSLEGASGGFLVGQTIESSLTRQCSRPASPAADC